MPKTASSLPLTTATEGLPGLRGAFEAVYPDIPWEARHSRADWHSKALDFAQIWALATQVERGRCCGIVFGQCASDNVAQRTVDAIRKGAHLPEGATRA